MNKLLLLLLAALGLAGLAFSYSKKSDCFSPDFIRSDASFALGSAPLPDEVAAILLQPFHFLGSGNQAYAFESEDEKYVLKLFKFHCLKGREAKVERLKQGLLIAETEGKEHAGIIFVHFPPTLATKVRLRDKAGRKHTLLLDEYVFVLQEKARPLGFVLKEHLKQGNIEGAKQKLLTLFHMFSQDLQKGIYDQDHNVITNTGFIEERPIRIDFGKLTINHTIDRKKELNKIARERIRPWIKKNFPQFEAEIEEFLKIIL